MTRRSTHARTVAAVAAGLFALAPVAAPLALGPGLTPTAAAEAPARYGTTLVDHAGVLSPGEAGEIERKLADLQSSDGVKLYIVYVESFDRVDPKRWAEEALRSNGGADNMAVLAIATQDRLIGGWAANGAGFSGSALSDAAADVLSSSDGDWAGAALAAIDEVRGATPGETAAVVGGGIGTAAVVGGGAWAWARRNRKKRTAAQVEDAREINPRDVATLAGLDDAVLDELATEELVSTDESIRTARAELDLARAEFGDARVADLEKALHKSEATLERAFSLRRRLDDDIPEPEAERHGMLVQIISTCGIADDELDAQAERYRGMRDELLRAPQLADSLTRRLVELRTRLPEAEQLLTGLQERYNAQTLAPVAENADMGREHLRLGEIAIEKARRMLDKPAGQQSGLVDAIAEATANLDQADKLLSAIEHADENIERAKRDLQKLAAEVAMEVREARELLDSPQAAEFDRDALRAALQGGAAATQVADDRGSTEPLLAWSMLAEADAELDIQLEGARDAARALSLAMGSLETALADARAQVMTARDLVNTRRGIIGASARTHLSEAERLLRSASHATGETSMPMVRQGITDAQRATHEAQRAVNAARRDIDQERNRHYGSGGGGGSMLAGLVIGSLLSGGGGGYSGGFSGGGGFGGGGFGGSGGSAGF